MARPPNQDVLRELDNVEDWPALVKKMTAYAARLVRTKARWQGASDLPKGYEIQDLVSKTLKKLFSGERGWDPNVVPLEVWLRENIRSEMSNLLGSAYTKSGELREMPLDPQDPNEPEGGFKRRPAIEAPTLFEGARTTEEALIDKEARINRDRLIQALYTAIDGDELLERMYDGILEIDDRRPRVLAELLGVPKEDVENALRRLDRHASRLQVSAEGVDDE